MRVSTLLVGIALVCLVVFGDLRGAEARMKRNHPRDSNASFEQPRESHKQKRDDGTPIQPGPNGVNHRVTNRLPDALEDYDTPNYAGYITINTNYKGVANMFYWLFESENSPRSDPLIIWMNGGPGCSSFDGLFIENISPYRFNSECRQEPQILRNTKHWNQQSSVLFIDQPVGTGYSYGDDLPVDDMKTLDGIYAGINAAADNFYRFLQEFLEYYPQYQQTEIYFMGESYAGQYIPYYAHYILSKNASFINLAGVGIGNGWIDPWSAYKSYVDYSFGIGLIGLNQKYTLDQSLPKCNADLARVRAGTLKTNYLLSCEDILDDIVDSSGGSDMVVYYDVRLYGDSTTYPEPYTRCMEDYLERGDVKAALHVTTFPSSFHECNSAGIDDAFVRQRYMSTTQDIVYLLNHNVRVLLFSGQFDLICNHISTSYGLQDVTTADWKYIDSFKAATVNNYMVNGEISGYLQQYNNLAWIKLLGGGHMVPFDQPAVMVDIVEGFTRNNLRGSHVEALKSSKNGVACSTGSRSKSTPKPSSDDSSTGSTKIILFGIIGTIIALVIGIAIGALVARYAINKRNSYEVHPDTELTISGITNDLEVN